jgi:hypothetical protein
MGKALDLMGIQVGRLTVVEKSQLKIWPGGARVWYWKCKCSCGNYVEVSRANLRNERTQSCGCITRERMRKQGQSLARSQSPRRDIFSHMRSSAKKRGLALS